LVFGKRAGDHAAAYVAGLPARPEIDEQAVDTAIARALAPLERDSQPGTETPYELHKTLQETMQSLVGIIRTRGELEDALARLAEIRTRAVNVAASGTRKYNPGWHLAMDIPTMLTVSECIARAALEREESRGGHTRDDFPGPNPEWGKLNLVLRREGDEITITRQDLPQMPDDLAELFEGTH
jgi:succinate dehydrogenase / fumarate reductase flavoprotein subunit